MQSSETDEISLKRRDIPSTKTWQKSKSLILPEQEENKKENNISVENPCEDFFSDNTQR